MLTPEVRERAKAARRVAPSRRQKMAAFAETFVAMRREFPRMALPIITQAEQGSLPAAIKLRCLECSAWERREVRDCAVGRCPLYPHRPYQGIKGRNPNDSPTGQGERAEDLQSVTLTGPAPRRQLKGERQGELFG